MKLITPNQVLTGARAALGLSVDEEKQLIDDAMLAQLLRTVAWSHCPCLPLVLIREAERCLKGLVSVDDNVTDKLSQVLEILVATGDLLEPGQVTHADELPRGVLFPAPPSFAMLSDELAQLFGVAHEDEFDGLPELQGRVVHDGVSRRVMARPRETLHATLRMAGLRELSMQAWLREPTDEPAADYLVAARKRLKRAEPADAFIDGLEIFNSTIGGIYLACWVPPSSNIGLFVARRPKAYGSHLWMLVELDGDHIVQTLHLPISGSMFRGCDEAWRMQLALDAVNGHPQQYRVRRKEGSSYLDMLFPVPSWAHRHLLALGREAPRMQSICSYEIPELLLGEACSFLEKRLWLKRTN